MLRWMAPFLSFTAEEAWKVFDRPAGAPAAGDTIYTETYWEFGPVDEALLAKWQRIRAVRELVNKEIETLREQGRVGSSLQADVALTAPPEDYAVLASLGDDLKFVFITSSATVEPGGQLAARVVPSSAVKCERCWHWRADVGSSAQHPTLCARCVSNLYGAGEQRVVA
jgi:isoleucyl-tRNA synthetase